MPKRLQLPYQPEPPPQGLDPYVYRELQRLADALTANPSGFGVSQSGLIAVDDTPVRSQLFLDQDAYWSSPDGVWNPITAEMTVPESGIYQLNFQMWLQEIDLPGQRTYGVDLFVDINGVQRYQVADYASEEYDTTATAAVLAPLAFGDVLTFWCETEAEVGGDATPFTAFASMVKIAQ